MKELLVIFIILLVLLMLISTFGGSIKTPETFYQATPILPTKKSTDEEMYRIANMPPMPPMPDMPPVTTMPSDPPFDIPDSVDLRKMNVEPFDNLDDRYASV